MDSADWINLITFAAWAVLFVLSVSFVIAFVVIDGKAKDIVRENSIRLERLKSLSMKYQFNRSIKSRYNYNVNLPSKRSYDSFSLSSYLAGLSSSEKDSFNLLIKTLDENKQNYQLYLEELSDLPPMISKETCQAITRIPYGIISHYESSFTSNARIKPITESKAAFIVRYTSPKGRNSYFKRYECSMSQISILINQKSVTNSMKTFQRSLMTDSLRYEVMKRDGFRCVLCGRSAKDGVVLHVDHICPVSKGGKTEKSNLRTLCESCNRGKGAKYEPNGLN